MRLGIFGGSFDPIHYGHLRMAEVAREAIALERVLLVPNRVSPFKTGRAVTPGPLRADMVRSAIADNPAFVLDTRELERTGPSYTVDTLEELDRENPGTELFFLTGTDAVRDLASWRRPEDILRLARFIVLSRPGVGEAEVRAALPPAWGERLLFVTMPQLEIASTDLRARVQTGKSIRYLLPPSVAAFVEAHGLYREEPEPISAQGETN